MPAEPKLIVVDDDLRDVKPIETAAGAAGVRVTLVKALESQIETLALVMSELAEAAPVVLVDYRLDLPAEVHYRGGSLAAGLKDQVPSIPLVLLTSDANMHSLLATRPGSKSLFDWSVLKDNFASPTEAVTVVRQLEAIADGFARAESTNPDIEINEELLRELTKGATKDLDGAEMWFDREVRGRVPGQVARWIFSTFLEVISPLVSEAEAAAECGLTTASFVKIAESLDDLAPYGGVFSGMAVRYWRSDLQALMQGLEAGPLSGLIELGRCTWCGERVERSCSVCSLACDVAHALPTAVQAGPWGLPAVACFRCVAEGREGAQINDLDPDVSDIVDLLITGQLD